MKKIQRASELLWLLGIILVALGVAICNKADLGVSMIAAPAFVVYEAIAPLWSGFSVGVAEYSIQAVLLVLLCVSVRRFHWRYLLAFGVAVLYGYILNLFLWLLGGVRVEAVWLRWILLLVGDCVTALGVACFFRTYLPLQVYELFVAELAAHFHWNINRVKAVFDLSLLGISVVLALTLFGDVGTFPWEQIGSASFHSIGLGTLVTTCINSPLIAWMGKRIDGIFDAAPRFAGLAAALKAGGKQITRS